MSDDLRDAIAVCPACGFLVTKLKPKDIEHIRARRCRGQAMVIGKPSDPAVSAMLTKRARALKINEAFTGGR